jgi:hypothetical protein
VWFGAIAGALGTPSGYPARGSLARPRHNHARPSVDFDRRHRGGGGLGGFERRIQHAHRIPVVVRPPQVDVSVVQQGRCTVFYMTSTGTGTSTGSAKGLDAGTVSVTGPGGSGLANQSIPGQPTFAIVPGGYTLNGAGGADVGTFSTSLTSPSPLTLSSPLPATVNRSSPLTLNWTGGNAPDMVEIYGYSSTSTGAGSS